MSAPLAPDDAARHIRAAVAAHHALVASREERDREIIAALDAGATAYLVARELGVAVTTVSRIHAKHRTQGDD